MGKYWLFIGVLVGCSSNVSDSDRIRRDLIGQWSNVSLNVLYHSYKNSDSSYYLIIDESNWETELKIKPILTTFNENGSYDAAHWDLTGKLFYHPAGRWSIVGDSLILQDTIPKTTIYKYKIVIQGDTAKFYGVEDFDRDGMIDDEYAGIQKRVK